MSEQRFIDLETKMIHQDLVIEELNQVVYRQQKQIDQLEATLTTLINRLRDSSQMGPDVGPADEKPPHY